jgi:hypothetical protein
MAARPTVMACNPGTTPLGPFASLKLVTPCHGTYDHVVDRPVDRKTGTLRDVQFFGRMTRYRSGRAGAVATGISYRGRQRSEDAMSMAKLRSPLVARKKSPPLGLIRSWPGWFLLWLWLGAYGRNRRR